MGPLTNITYYITHIIQILHKICSSCHYQNWVTYYTVPTQSSTSFGLWAKLKESPKSKSPTMMWLIPKSHYDVANSMSHYDVANSKPATMRHYLQIQSPLRCSTIQKARCYAAILYKISKSFLQSPNSYLASIFTKPKSLFGIYFHKTQILIWHYQAQILSWQLLCKAQILIWRLSLRYFYKSPNANLASILQNLKPFQQLSYKAQNDILAKTITLYSKPKC